MSNPILPTNGTHELVERYTDTIIKLKRKQNVVRNFFNRDYVGDPKAGAVKFTKRNTEVAVANYNIEAGAALTQSATEYVDALINNNLAVNELIDGYEAAAVPDNLIAQRLDSAAFSMGRQQELDAIAVLEDANTGATVETANTATAAANVYSSIVESISQITRLGIPKETLVVVIPDATEVKLLTDEKYSNTAAVTGAQLIRDGIIGGSSKINGVPVVVSSNLSAGVEWLVFSSWYAATAEEWVVPPTINDIRNAAHIGASALQGRMVYKDVLLDRTAARIKKVA